MMRGWKTWTGAVLVAASAGLEYMGQRDVAASVAAIGVSLGLVGIGHKVDKASRSVIPVRRNASGKYVKRDS